MHYSGVSAFNTVGQNYQTSPQIFSDQQLLIFDRKFNSDQVYERICNLPKYDWAEGMDESDVLNRTKGHKKDKIHEIREMVTLEDKSIYEGEWDKDRNTIDGRGVKIWPDGTRYDGTWFQG